MADRQKWTRRSVLAAALSSTGAAAAAGLGGDGEGNLYGGTMALQEAYNVSGDLWIGPDSAKANVDAESGRVYMASDTEVEYYGDGGSWVKRDVGSPSEPVSDIHSESLTTEETETDRLEFTETASPREDGAEITKTEALSGRMPSSQFPSGSIIPCGLPHRITDSNISVTVTDYEDVHAGTDKTGGLIFGALPTPPNTVPILAIRPHYHSHTSGDQYDIRVRTPKSDDAIVRVRDYAEGWGFDLGYLNEVNGGTGSDREFGEGRIVIEHRQDSGDGTLYADSFMYLWLEVL